MPLPSNLASIVKKASEGKTKFDPARVRPEAAAYAATWRLYLDLLEMDQTKLGALIERHGDETDEMLIMRQQLAAIFNYVPTIIRMSIFYLHSEQPVYDIADRQLKAFLSNCDGSGKSFVEYIRHEALPMALVLGFVDTLIQNPATPEGLFVTAADQAEASNDLLPRVLTVTPLQRTDWSCTRDHAYQWLRFKDSPDEGASPFADPAPTVEAYITISGFVNVVDDKGNDLSIRPEDGPDAGRNVGYWIRSYRDISDPNQKGQWIHDGDFFAVGRTPVATLYYQKSIDPTRRHFGLSKVAMIAILTKKIIQLLSWSDEDVLSNLAVFVMPGVKPVDKEGKDVPVKLSPWTILWLGNDAARDPKILQGDVGHIKTKWEIISAYIQEILRLAFLIGASGTAEMVTSGVQAVVSRNELFQELSDIAGALDAFALDVLSIAASLIKSEDIDQITFVETYKPKVTYYKGPYAIDPLADVIKNSQELIAAFRDISPTMVTETYRSLAQAALYNEDQARQQVFAEIDANVKGDIERQRAQNDALLNASNAAAEATLAATNNANADLATAE